MNPRLWLKWARVNARIVLRWIVRTWTGAVLIPLPDGGRVHRELVTRYFRALMELHTTRPVHPLTPVIVAWLCGTNLPPFSGRERYRSARLPRTNLRKGIPYRVVGRPAVYKTPKGVTYSETEWSNGYVSRQEQLAARKRAKTLDTVVFA